MSNLYHLVCSKTYKHGRSSWHYGDEEVKVFKTKEEIKEFIDNHEYMKRVKGLKGKVFVDKTDGSSQEVGFILQGHYTDFEYQGNKKVNYRVTEQWWCEVFELTRILI